MEDRIGFIYCEDYDGGMSEIDFYRDEAVDSLKRLSGWMRVEWREEDKELLDFIETAEPGEYAEHRLGTCFCVWSGGKA